MTKDKKAEPDLTDKDNPEWKKADFKRAIPARELPADMLAAFPKTQAKKVKR